MIISFRLLVLVIAALLCTLFIIFKIASASFDEEQQTEYPLGSFEVHMFFERPQNYL
ncbi:TPA: hypothetical protein RQJ43_002807 [Vibrio vulnificus]|nr:hypothetical protein [Vibrio vulnificus]